MQSKSKHIFLSILTEYLMNGSPRNSGYSAKSPNSQTTQTRYVNIWQFTQPKYNHQIFERIIFKH